VAAEVEHWFRKIIKARINLLNSISVWRVGFKKAGFSGEVRR